MLLGRASILGSLAALVGACSASVESYDTDAETGSTHAFVSIERRVRIDGTEHLSTGAVAGFVRAPAALDARSVAGLIGLGLDLPEPGQCAQRGTGRRSEMVLSSIGLVELLDAGDVTIEAEGEPTLLAPRAFPTVTDSISGVLYTSRDRSEPLPAMAPYRLKTSGGSNLPALRAEAFAPGALEQVTVGGLPLEELTEIDVRQPMDLTWAVGEPGDLVYVELAVAGQPTTICSFRDDAGAGTVSGSLAPAGASGRVGVHRLRSLPFTAEEVDRAELRFDFELSAQVDFIDG